MEKVNRKIGKKEKEEILTLRLTLQEADALTKLLNDEIEGWVGELGSRDMDLNCALEGIKDAAQIWRKLLSAFYWKGRGDARKKVEKSKA